MKINEALDIISEAVRNGEIYDLKQSIIKPLKKAYGVEDLVFWKDNSNWFYCGFKKPNPNLWHDSHRYQFDNFDDLLYYLSSLQAGKGLVFFEGKRYESLNDLKQEILIRKLAGLEAQNG